MITGDAEEYRMTLCVSMSPPHSCGTIGLGDRGEGGDPISAPDGFRDMTPTGCSVLSDRHLGERWSCESHGGTT